MKKSHEDQRYREHTTVGVGKNAFRWIMRFLIVLFLLGGVLNFSNYTSDIWTAPVIWGLLLLGGAALLAFYVWYFRMRPIKKSTDRGTEPIQVASHRIYLIQQSASQSQLINQVGSQVFVRAVLDPRTFRQRVREIHEPDGSFVKQRVEVEAQLPADLISLRKEQDDPPSLVPFPVMLPVKGEFSDDLRVLGPEGEELQVLSYPEYLQVVAAIIRGYLSKALESDVSGMFKQEAQDAEEAAITCVMARTTRSAPTNDTRKVEAGRAVKGILTLKAGLEKATEMSHPELQVVSSLVRTLSQRYAVVVLVPFGENGRFRVAYERKAVPSAIPDPKSVLASLRRHLRFFLGARPANLTVSLGLAATSQNYHLLVDGGEGVYVGYQVPHGVEEAAREYAEAATTANADYPPPYYRLHRRLGQSYAHFYARFFPDIPKGRRAELRLNFFEVPPGSLFRAVIASTACFSLVWLMGFVVSSVGQTSALETDAPAFLLAFPAVAVTLVGFDGPARGLLQGTLAARIALICTTVISIAASGLFLLYRAAIIDVNEYYLFGLSFLGVDELYWVVLVVASFANAAYPLFLYGVRHWEFKYLSSRPARTDRMTEYN